MRFRQLNAFTSCSTKNHPTGASKHKPYCSTREDGRSGVKRSDENFVNGVLTALVPLTSNTPLSAVSYVLHCCCCTARPCYGEKGRFLTSSTCEGNRVCCTRVRHLEREKFGCCGFVHLIIASEIKRTLFQIRPWTQNHSRQAPIGSFLSSHGRKFRQHTHNTHHFQTTIPYLNTEHHTRNKQVLKHAAVLFEINGLSACLLGDSCRQGPPAVAGQTAPFSSIGSYLTHWTPTFRSTDRQTSVNDSD